MRSLRVLLAFLARPLAGALVVGGLLGASTLAAQRPAPATTGAGSVRWPVRTLPSLDLWLHAFAMLSNDSASAPTVPLYRRGYRDSVATERRRQNVLTSLDGNQATLVEGLGRAGGYTNAQFVPFEYATWEDFRRSADLFVQVKGDLNRAPTRAAQQQMVPLANVFPTATDREWLRLFFASITDERTRWYDAEFVRVQTERRAVRDAVDQLWQQQRPRFDRFLTNSGQRQGDIVLSLPVGGEGRTTTTGASAAGPARTMIAVPFPARVEDAPEALYVLAHELTGALVGPVVADNVTPAETRSGRAARYTSLAQVVSGALLLQRIAPELVTGYQRYYLTQVGVRIPAGSEVAALFTTTFTLSSALRDALVKQLDLVLGGI
jgi:hypothetical protein